MTHPAARTFLVVVAFAAVGGAGYLLWQLDQHETGTRRAAAAYEVEASQALVLIERLRGAQQSYVAEGQGAQFWMTRVDEVFDALERSLTTLGGAAPAAELRDAAHAAGASLDELRRLDRRAREWIRSGDRLMASDLIFAESLATSGTIATALATIRSRHRQIVEADLADLRSQQLYAASGAAGLSLIVLLLLAPAVRAAAPRDTREALRALIGDGAPAGQTSLRVDAHRAAAAPVATPPSMPPQAVAKPAPPPARTVDIAAAAGLCSDFARVLDPAELPRLLEQAGKLLDATGLIVWVGDRHGEALYPLLAHGYPPGVLERLGSLHRNDDNAAAEAYRLGELRTVGAKAGIPGAIVTPIVTPDGCIGVFTAEVRNGTERDGERQALARILAAQLSTLVTALPAVDRPVQASGAGL